LFEAAFTRTRFQIDTVASFRNRIKKFTVSKRLHENDLSVFSAVTSWPRHVLLPGSGDDYTLKRCHFVLKMAKRKDVSNFVSTDDELELLLRITNEYKVAKSAENAIGSLYIKNAMRYWSDSKRQTEAVFKKTGFPPFTRHMKPYRFENAPLLKRCGCINYFIIAV